MIKVSASNLKAKMGQYMKAVRAGKEVTITDREEPVARIVPYRRQEEEASLEAIGRDPTAPALGKLKIRGTSRKRLDTLSVLLKDRDSR
ncbi:MAG: type II toxin-antitoxin system Phd/YefM family antitoxin [Myxococcaceae bacterium]